MYMYCMYVRMHIHMHMRMCTYYTHASKEENNGAEGNVLIQLHVFSASYSTTPTFSHSMHGVHQYPCTYAIHTLHHVLPTS